MAFFKKNKSAATESSSPKKQVIKVNPYENPENVMELMANICTAQASADTELYWKIVREAYNRPIEGVSLSYYLKNKETRDNLWNKDFDHDLNDYLTQLSWSLTSRENTAHTQIVVAGGFSSGKSSFLNRITDSTNLLPTGTEPVSVVKTYLYCSRNAHNIVVKGVNQKNVLVNLDTGVLQAIQHANKSNIYLASVLDELFVEIPSSNLDGLVFIDTPGYNNSDRANKSNGKTDKETALEAMAEGNVLFWFIGSDRPTITEDDMEIIRKFNGRKVIIFNKADKHGSAESKKIVEDGARIIFGEFAKEDIIDIIAYSSLENKVYYSYFGMSIVAIVDEAKKSGNGMSELNNIKSLIESLFDDEIYSSEVTLNGTNNSSGYLAELQTVIESKNECYKFWQKDKADNKGFLESIKDIMVDNYNTVKQAASDCYKYADYAFSNWLKFHNGVLNFENNDHWGTSSILDKAISESADSFNKKNKKFYNLDWSTYNEEFRNKQYEVVANELQKLNDMYKEWYDEESASCDRIQEKIDIEKKIQKQMAAFKNAFLAAVEQGIFEYNKKNKATSFSAESKFIPNVFECIKEDNYKSFLRAFEEGVDLAVCNADGYSPLTLAVEQGNNAMVKFMLDHDADPCIKDKRGYNAFHTAVENQYRDICKMLLDIDPDLINSKTSHGEDVEDLANKGTFVKWIKNEIDNAF